MKKRTFKPGNQKNFRIQNVEDIIKLEQRDQTAMKTSDKIANTITDFSGSVLYVVLHIIWFGGWIIINFGLIHGIKPFDPFPFSLLTMIVSLEAIFLSSFVLISQNKQALQADKRAKVDLQINMISERENTKLIEMIAEIQQHLKIHKKEDAQVKELEKTTNVNKLADKLDTEEKNNKRKNQNKK